MASNGVHPSRSFWFENQCFTVINPSRVEFLPGLRIVEPERNLTAKDLRKAVWALEKGPEMAYMLRSSHPDCSLLARLSCDPRNLPIVATPNQRYALTQDVLTTWQDLEQSLVIVSEILLVRISKIPEAKFPFDAFWPSPSSLGYQNHHSTFASARRAILTSRDAFFLLASRCTLAIALHQFRWPDESPPAWVTVLLERGVPAPWIDELRGSPITDLSPGLRVGAFLDPQPDRTLWMDHVPCMIKANLPTYIAWPTQEGKLDASLCEKTLRNRPYLRPYFPDSADGAVVIPTSQDERMIFDPHPRALNPQTCFRWDDFPSAPPPVTVATVSTAPPPTSDPIPSDDELRRLPHGPGQRPGESYEQFFERREAQWRQWEEKESAERKQKRLARAKKAETYSCPTRPSETFLWVEIGDVDATVPWYCLQYDYRKKVRFGGVRDIWALYPNSHKRYDPWRDEWDICPKLSDEPILEEDDFDDDGGPYAPESPVTPESSQQSQSTAISPATIARSFEADLQRFYARQDFVGHTFVPEGFQEVMLYRYGVITSVPTTESGERPQEYVAFKGEQLQKYFGVLPMDLDDTHLAPLSGFVSFVLKGSTNPAIPAAIWNLDASCAQYVLRSGHQHPTLRLEYEKLSGAIYYRISYTGEPSCWYDVCVDATTAVELFRRQSIRSRAMAVSFMVQKGISFHTLYSPSKRYSFYLGRSPFGDCLGWRPRGFRPTRYDYEQYLAQAYEVLCQPRGRAAVLCGGIIWRLALEVLGSDAVERVVEGPSDDVYYFGEQFFPRHGDPLYDDSLTSGELDILCGVYKLPSNKGREPELLSWWPRPNVFDTSGLAFGYWTPWCENWFQRRLQRIKDGTEGPLAAKQWRKAITFWKGVFPLRNAVEKVSEGFLLNKMRVSESL